MEPGLWTTGHQQPHERLGELNSVGGSLPPRTRTHTHTQLFAMAWSPCGRYLATFCKDGTLALYDPRIRSKEPIQEGVGPEGRRGGRLVWLDTEHILVSGFNKLSTRTLSVYATSDLSKPKSVISLNVSPATLMPTFDPDVKLVYVTGKVCCVFHGCVCVCDGVCRVQGDKTILVFEYVPDKHPYLFDVSPFSCPSSHQVREWGV